MAYSDEELTVIFDRTDGKCHICGDRLAFRNYAKPNSAWGAWEVEHSNPKAKGGTNRRNNLYAAHITCNRSKGARSTRSVRAQHGRTAAPLSAKRKQQLKTGNAVACGGLGLLLGSLGGPVGAITVATLGAVLGYEQNVE